MGKSLTLGAILGAIVLFIWMIIAWMFIPWHDPTLGSFTHEESVSSIIMANTEKNGMYLLPSWNELGKEGGVEALKRGPIIFMALQRNGYDFQSAKPYVSAFIIPLIAAFLVTLMLLQARPLTYRGRLWFVFVFGIAAGVLATFSYWNWWGFSFSFALVSFLDIVIGWFLAGLVIAAVTKQKAVPAA